MQITDILAQAGGLQAMARELGISEADAAKGAAALAPAILGGFKKQAQAQPSGLEGLGGLLGQLGGGNLLSQVLAPEPTDVSQGNDVLGQIFGSKDVSRTVAANAASQTGVDQGVLKRMLPMLAMMIAGYMATQRGQSATASSGSAASASASAAQGGLGGLLGGLLGGSSSASSGSSGPTSGLGGLGSMLDMNGDGNPLDDILRMAGKRLG
jgi:hypothetical protein